MLFQLLTGERPFEGSMATIMHKALNTVPPKPSELSVTAPISLDPVVARAMAKRPDERFPTAAAFADALQAALADPKPASALGPRPWRPRRGRDGDHGAPEKRRRPSRRRPRPPPRSRARGCR